MSTGGATVLGGGGSEGDHETYELHEKMEADRRGPTEYTDDTEKYGE